MLKRRPSSPEGSGRTALVEPPTAAGMAVLGEPDGIGPTRTGGLVLARRLNEVIVIGDEVEVEVVGLKVNAVRLMLTAPFTIPIHRLEIYEASRAAARTPVPEGPAPVGRGRLVLTRRVGQRIVIGERIQVEVADIRGGAVRLRVMAPRDVAVDRQEIREAILRDRTGLPG